MANRNQERSRTNPPIIHQVWASNFNAEICRLEQCLQFHTVLSIDTEFPGFIRNTPRGSTDDKLYQDFRFNVNQTKLIQLGLTACDDSGKIGGSWEFNFSDFDPHTDSQNSSSVSFLQQNGLDFDKLKKHGIPINLFVPNFLHIIRKHNVFRWVTFHGLYDIGYLLKAMGIMEVLPESMAEFATVVVRRLGIVRDLKYMARFCEGLEEGKLGLENLGKLLDQNRYGSKHNAGSDSLLTASSHFEMIQRFDLDSRICDGYLYGFSNKLQSMDINMHHHKKIILNKLQSSMGINMYHHHHQKIITFGPIPYGIPIYCYTPPPYITYY